MERIAIMSNIRLIISDIDGTILTSNHQVDEQLIEVMPELEKANIPFVLASARSPLGMQPIAHKLGLHDNPIACYNGALVLGVIVLSSNTLWIKLRFKNFLATYPQTTQASLWISTLARTGLPTN